MSYFIYYLLFIICYFYFLLFSPIFLSFPLFSPLLLSFLPFAFFASSAPLRDKIQTKCAEGADDLRERNYRFLCEKTPKKAKNEGF
jgi:hypothetical protein